MPLNWNRVSLWVEWICEALGFVVFVLLMLLMFWVVSYWDSQAAAPLNLK